MVVQGVFENLWCPPETLETLICNLNSNTTILLEETLYIFLVSVRMHGRWNFSVGKDKSFAVSQCTQQMDKYTIQVDYKPRHSRTCT
jgi:hypothetical protein